jgi:hypothetical protein
MTMKRASGCFRLTVERGSSSFEKRQKSSSMTIRRGHLATLTERTEAANHARTSSPFVREARIGYHIKSLQTARWPWEQPQYRDHFYARFELSLNFAFDNHYLTGEHIGHLRDAMRNYT